MTISNHHKSFLEANFRSIKYHLEIIDINNMIEIIKNVPNDYKSLEAEFLAKNKKDRK